MNRRFVASVARRCRKGGDGLKKEGCADLSNLLKYATDKSLRKQTVFEWQAGRRRNARMVSDSLHLHGSEQISTEVVWGEK